MLQCKEHILTITYAKGAEIEHAKLLTSKIPDDEDTEDDIMSQKQNVPIQGKRDHANRGA